MSWCSTPHRRPGRQAGSQAMCSLPGPLSCVADKLAAAQPCFQGCFVKLDNKALLPGCRSVQTGHRRSCTPAHDVRMC